MVCRNLLYLKLLCTRKGPHLLKFLQNLRRSWSRDSIVNTYQVHFNAKGFSGGDRRQNRREDKITPLRRERLHAGRTHSAAISVSAQFWSIEWIRQSCGHAHREYKMLRIE